jgi:alpha-tubulin suppressor-like RCC1 family protein
VVAPWVPAMPAAGAPVVAVSSMERDRSVRVLPRAISVESGEYHALVIADDGVPYGIGETDAGRLTTPGVQPHLLMVAGLPDRVRALAAAGGLTHSLVLGDDGEAYGTGQNWGGQLTGREHRRVLTPLEGLPPGVRAIDVAAGWAKSLVLGSDGSVYGAGSAGEVTGSTGAAQRSLVPLAGLPSGVGATSVAADGNVSLVLGDDGIAYGAGDNYCGQLTGSERWRTRFAPLVGLPAGVHAREVVTSGCRSVVRGSDGVVYATSFDSPTRALAAVDGLPGASGRGPSAAAAARCW